MRELELAEHECPWGETADTLRAVYLADEVRGVLGDKQSAREARAILGRLLGPSPARKRKTLKTLLKDRKDGQRNESRRRV